MYEFGVVATRTGVESVAEGAILANDIESTSFADLYDSEYDRQVRRAYLLLGSGNDAHDVVAECLVALHRRWESVRNPAAYLNRSVTNACHRHSRRHRRERVDQPDHRRADPSATTGFDRVDIGDALLALPFRQRAAVVLRFYGGLTENEIAHALGIRPGSVGPTLHRAMNRLREVLQ